MLHHLGYHDRCTQRLILNICYLVQRANLIVPGDMDSCQQAVLIGGEISRNLLHRARRSVTNTSAALHMICGDYSGVLKIWGPFYPGSMSGDGLIMEVEGSFLVGG
jgi:hypothetical protein